MTGAAPEKQGSSLSSHGGCRSFKERVMEKPPRMEVVRRAYELWEQAGKPEGRDQEFYLQAERELSTPPATPEEKSANPDEKSETFLE